MGWTKEDFINGEILLFNKPYRWTSFEMVNKVRYAICKKYQIKKLKVGHAGTLDPLATGLLIICTGKATKKISDYQNLEKKYIAEITLGATTPSFDLETSIDKTYKTDHITKEYISKILTKFKGDSKQVPPVFSAKNVDGERAYNLARLGKPVLLEPTNIHISKIELIYYNNNKLKIAVKCSKGTYIRALARDIGYALNSGGYISSLSRTEIGLFSIDKSLEFNQFENLLQ